MPFFREPAGSRPSQAEFVAFVTVENVTINCRPTRREEKMDAERLELESFLPYRLNRLADVVSREFSAIYREKYGLTRPEWRLLATLGQYQTMTATEIGRHSAMHKTKVSRAVTALEKRRWLLRDADGADRRVEHLRLTKAGEEAYRTLVPLAKAFEAELLGKLDDGERQAVSSGLRLLERIVPLSAGEAFAERRKRADFEAFDLKIWSN
jgi:DNA-binding MarR family transcriptional regulator